MAQRRRGAVYDIEPFRAALRNGDWKLVWQATLPSRVELFNLGQDPGETTDVAGKYPQKVAELQQRIETLARDAVPPLFLAEGGCGEAHSFRVRRITQGGNGSRASAMNWQERFRRGEAARRGFESCQ